MKTQKQNNLRKATVSAPKFKLSMGKLLHQEKKTDHQLCRIYSKNIEEMLHHTKAEANPRV